uniref:Uncharacterized protein n=1 Tax=Arundo donax TaxID=35708 RepID=A0A0A8Z597_ARUDO
MFLRPDHENTLHASQIMTYHHLFYTLCKPVDVDTCHLLLRYWPLASLSRFL